MDWLADCASTTEGRGRVLEPHQFPLTGNLPLSTTCELLRSSVGLSFELGCQPARISFTSGTLIQGCQDSTRLGSLLYSMKKVSNPCIGND